MASPDRPRACPNCGTEVASTDRVCWRCYRPLPPPTPPPPQPKHRRRRRLPTSVLFTAVLAVALGGYFWHVRSSPTGALLAYLRAEEAGDVRTAYRLLSLRSRMMINPEDLTVTGRKSATTPIYVVRSVEREHGGAKVTLDVTVAEPSGAAPGTSTVCMYMAHEGGAWRVDMVRTSQAQANNVMIGEHGWLRLWLGGGRK